MNELQVVNGQAPGGSGGGAIVDFEFGSAADFRRRMAEMKQKYNAVQEFFQEVMVKDEDFGVIPGTQKPSLYKPGAEKLCELYGFAAIVKEKVEERSYETGFYRVSFTLQMVHRSSGVVIGEGVGECSTNESKYMYRWVSESKVPRHLDKEDLLYEEKNGSNGSYRSFRIPNEDLYSQWNTVLKMAYKRAYVGLTLQCTRSSGIFTQDEAEMDDYADVAPEDRKQQRGGRAANANSGRYSGGGQQGGGSSGSSGGGRSSGAAGNDKNRAFELAKQLNGGTMDWKWLGDRAGEVLGRTITKVVTDVKDAEWKVVADYLEQYGHGGSQSSDFNPDDLPEGLR